VAPRPEFRLEVAPRLELRPEESPEVAPRPDEIPEVAPRPELRPRAAEDVSNPPKPLILEVVLVEILVFIIDPILGLERF